MTYVNLSKDQVVCMLSDMSYGELTEALEALSEYYCDSEFDNALLSTAKELVDSNEPTYQYKLQLRKSGASEVFDNFTDAIDRADLVDGQWIITKVIK